MALEGAIQGVKKTMLSDDVKADLKEFMRKEIAPIMTFALQTKKTLREKKFSEL